MNRMSTALKIAGCVIAFLGFCPGLRHMWEENRRYGMLGLMTFPIATIVWAALNMGELKLWFWIQIAGCLLYGAGIYFEPPAEPIRLPGIP
jgi:hypothetical protein